MADKLRDYLILAGAAISAILLLLLRRSNAKLADSFDKEKRKAYEKESKKLVAEIGASKTVSRDKVKRYRELRRRLKFHN